MEIADLIGLMVPATCLLMWAVERLAPARHFPPRRGWDLLGLVFLLLIGAVSTVVPLLFDPAWLAAHRWLDGSRLGGVGGTL